MVAAIAAVMVMVNGAVAVHPPPSSSRLQAVGDKEVDKAVIVIVRVDGTVTGR